MKLRFMFLVAVCALGACGSKKEGAREAWPVGLRLGGVCSYSAPATVATLENGGKEGTLIGEGQLVEKCADSSRTIDVVKATALEIEGPETLKVGESKAEARTYKLALLAGKRRLTRISGSKNIPAWWADTDCNDVAKIDDPPLVQGTAGPEIDRRVTAIKAGPCTLRAQVMSLTTTRTIKIF